MSIKQPLKIVDLQEPGFRKWKPGQTVILPNWKAPAKFYQ
jgi:hypothetical protein